MILIEIYVEFSSGDAVTTFLTILIDTMLVLMIFYEEGLFRV